VAQIWWPALRRWMHHMCPIIAGAFLLLCVWEVITSGFRLLPMPYFPGPAGVLQSLMNDSRLLFDSTWHSLVLLLGGYAFGVAVPAAMPNLFIGLFMGLGASFLTLVVAETVGVKSGLGWYVSWAQGWAEYGKVYAALIIMAAFFSTIMTLLFKVRDRMLVWQKGVIKW